MDMFCEKGLYCRALNSSSWIFNKSEKPSSYFVLPVRQLPHKGLVLEELQRDGGEKGRGGVVLGQAVQEVGLQARRELRVQQLRSIASQLSDRNNNKNTIKYDET